MHATPAGLPFGIPGNGVLIESAMQQAPQWGLQLIGSCLSPRPSSSTGYSPQPRSALHWAKVLPSAASFASNGAGFQYRSP